MDLQYELRNGSYYLTDHSIKPSTLTGEREILCMCDEVAIAFDRSSGTLHKHGDPKMVGTWAAAAQKKLREGGFPDMADDIIVMSGPIPIDEINKCISITGYCLRLYENLSTTKPALNRPAP